MLEGRAIDEREEGKADARDEKGDRDHGMPRAPRERESSQADGDRGVTRTPLEQAQSRTEQARAGDGHDEGDEARQEEQERAGGSRGGEGARVCLPSCDGDQDGEERAERCDVHR